MVTIIKEVRVFLLIVDLFTLALINFVSYQFMLGEEYTHFHFFWQLMLVLYDNNFLIICMNFIILIL